MKTVKLFFAIFGLFFFQQMQAQVAIGVKVGANLADANIKGISSSIIGEPNILPGFTAGVMAEIPMLNGFAFRPELNFIQKGFSVKRELNVDIFGFDLPLGGKANTRVNAIEMPLLIQYNIGNEKAGLYAIIGPNVSYGLNAHVRPIASFIIDYNLPRIDIDLDRDLYRRWEISGTAGVGGSFKAGDGKIFGDVRYTMGFSNLLDNPIVDVRIKNQAVNLSMGYAYQF